MMKQYKNFTLIEVLTAIAAFSIFMVIIIQFFMASSRLWSFSEKEAKLSAKANLALSTIEQYVRNAKISSSSGAPFYISDATINSKGRVVPVSPYDIMKENFQGGTRWEVDANAFNPGLSTKLIFSGTSEAMLASPPPDTSFSSGNFYILGFVQAHDKLLLRVISDKEANFSSILSRNRNDLGSEFVKSQESWLTGIADSDKIGSGRDNGSRVTHELINHMTRFIIYPYVLNTNYNGITDKQALKIEPDLTAFDTGRIPPYAIMVEIALMGDDDFRTWRAMCAERPGQADEESEQAKAFRNKTERTYSRLIYLGKPKEIR